MSMWYSAHRPRSLSECILEHLDDDARGLLQHAVRQETVPNLSLYGPPGTGKSTIASVLANKDRFIVNTLNGTDLEKNEISLLKRLIVSTSLFSQHRCIVIDELNAVRPAIQRSIRSMIDDAEVPVSWLFTCNDVNAVDKSLRSRLIEICCGYSSINMRERHLDGIAHRYSAILEAENITAPIAELREIAERCYPDVRAGINELQTKYSSQRAA